MILPASAFPIMRQVAQTTSYLLDLYPNAARAYSSRQLRAAQTNCITVRRASDNATQVIGFINGFLDTSAILSFCSGSDGFVTTVFDQSGNGQNAAQSNIAWQPRICNGGVIDVRGGLAGFGRFDGTSNFLDFTGIDDTTDTTLYFIGYVLDEGTDAKVILGGQSDSFECRVEPRGGGLARPSITRSFQVAVMNGDNFTANRVTSISYNAFGTMLVNNTQSGSLYNPSAYNGQMNAIGRTNLDGGRLYCYKDVMHELIIYNSNTSSNRSAITSNQMSYFGVT